MRSSTDYVLRLEMMKVNCNAAIGCSLLKIHISYFCDTIVIVLINCKDWNNRNQPSFSIFLQIKPIDIEVGAFFLSKDEPAYNLSLNPVDI